MFSKLGVLSALLSYDIFRFMEGLLRYNSILKQGASVLWGTTQLSLSWKLVALIAGSVTSVAALGAGSQPD